MLAIGYEIPTGARLEGRSGIHFMCPRTAGEVATIIALAYNNNKELKIR